MIRGGFLAFGVKYASLDSDERISKSVQALLLAEKQTAKEAKQAHATEQAKNVDLTKKLEDDGKKVDQLQDSVQRFVTNTMILKINSLVDHYCFSRISYDYIACLWCLHFFSCYYLFG